MICPLPRTRLGEPEMPRAGLDKNDTIITVFDKLTHPRPYGTGALHKMNACRREHGNAHVRIGVTGSGQKPCFRVTYLDEAASEQIYGSWWDTGDPLVKKDAINQNWAEPTVDHKTLEDFLAQRFKYSGPRPR